MRRVRSRIESFGGDASGSIALVFALSVLVLCFTAGLAVDASRAFSVSNRIASILDAAALAGAKLLDDDNSTDAQVQAKAIAFLNAHLIGFEVAGLTLANVVVTPNRADSSVNIAVDIQMPTTFGQLAGVPSFEFNKSSTVVYKMKKVELAMALDITGSMSATPSGDTRSRIASLKIAAKEVVDTVFDQAVNDTSIRVAIAPYSASVNPGAYAWSVTGGAAGGGCVVERSGASNATDDSPGGSSSLQPFSGSGTCPTQSVIPLAGRSQRSDIKNNIDNLAAGGSTAGHIGLAWAWYMLSPNWAGVFTGANAPSPYSTAGDVVKVAVIMTDGLFNTSYLSGAGVNSAAAVDESYAQFDALCANMKARGIMVFSIGFGLDDARAISELQVCASSAGNFFSVTTGTQLNTAFQTIVERLNTLRVMN